MNQGTKWVLLMEKNRSQKSNANVPLSSFLIKAVITKGHPRDYVLLDQQSDIVIVFSFFEAPGLGRIHQARNATATSLC